MTLAFVGAPFPPSVDRQSLETATLLNQLQPDRTTHQRAGCESWSCTWSSDGSMFAWSCGNNIVRLIPWNRCQHCMLQADATCDDLERLPYEQSNINVNAGELVWALAFGSDAPTSIPQSTNLNWNSGPVADLLLAIGLQSGHIKIWHLKSRAFVAQVLSHIDVIRDLCFSPDASLRLVSASRDGTLAMWQLSGKGVDVRCSLLRRRSGAPSKWMYGCCWSPDSRLLASVGDKSSVILWEMVNFSVVRHLYGHQHDVCGCEFSPDGALLATSSYDTTIVVWDPHLGTILLILNHLFPSPPQGWMIGANDTYVRDVSFSHDGRHIATVSDDGNLRFWDIYNPDKPCQVATVTNALCCQYSPDGCTLAVGTRNGVATLWRACMQVSSLQHLCRLAIRRLLPTDKIDRLDIPDRLSRFLRYAVHW